MTRDKQIYREYPGLKDEMHCIVYVRKVDSADMHDEEKSKVLSEEITDVRKEFTPESKLPFNEYEFCFSITRATLKDMQCSITPSVNYMHIYQYMRQFQ